MAAERVTGGFGSKLRDARERRGISLRQIANATKISTGQLEALERNDISRLPGGIFSRAFVRSYAVEVGLDPEATIQEFIAQFPHDSVTAGHPTAEQVEDHEALESDRRMASAFLRLIGLSIPVAGVVLYFGFSGRRAEAPTPPEPPTATAPRAVGAPATPPVAHPAESIVQAAAPTLKPVQPTTATDPERGRLLVGFVATAPCRVSATIDGQQMLDQQLQPGERYEFEVRRELVVTADDAAALTMTINGAEARSLGDAGQAVTRRVDLTNFKDYITVR